MEDSSLTLIRSCISWEGPLIVPLNFTVINIYFISNWKKKKLALNAQFLALHAVRRDLFDGG